MIPTHNNIIRFDDFNINELNSVTYHSAAKGLRKLNHTKRADNLLHWATVSEWRHLGLFNVNIHILERERYDNRSAKDIYFKILAPNTIIPSSNRGDRPGILLQSSPISCYLSGAWFVDPKDKYGEIEDIEEECSAIELSICVIPAEVNESIGIFNIEVKIIWEEGTFNIVEGSVDTVEGVNDWNQKVLFSDRLSARKFKSKFLEEKNIKRILSIDVIREFFMEYSTADNWDKYMKELQSIPVNKLYF